MTELLLTPGEAAGQLNVSVRTVYVWIESGRLASVKLSPRCTRVPASSVDALVRATMHQSRPDLSSLLWDIDPTRLDEDRDAAFLVGRILAAGRPEHVAWMFRRYPRSLIERTIFTDRRLPRRVAEGWQNLLELDGAPVR